MGGLVVWPFLTHSDGFEWVDGVQDGISYWLKGGAHPWADSWVIIHNQDRNGAKVE